MKHNGIELVPITEAQVFSGYKKLLVWDNDMEGLDIVYNDSNWEIIDVSAIINTDNGVIVIDKYGNKFDKCAEIPKAQKRDMNSLEVMEYLHKLQLFCNVDYKVDLQLPKEIEGKVDCRYGLIICNTGGDWFHFAQFHEAHNPSGFKFGILKNGKTTEFELPQVEL